LPYLIILVEDEVDDTVEDLINTMLVLNPLLLLMILLVSKLIDKILIPIKEITTTAKNINIDELRESIFCILLRFLVLVFKAIVK